MELNSRKATNLTSIASMLRNLLVPVLVIVAEIVHAAEAGLAVVEVAADDVVADVTVAAEDKVAAAVHGVVTVVAVVVATKFVIDSKVATKFAAFFCSS